jgi:carboxylate-amine ligase
MTAPRTLGVEEELHLVDLGTGRLTARAPELLRGLPDEAFSFELQRSTVETNTAIVRTLADLRREVTRLRSLLGAVAEPMGLGIVAAGTAPLSSAEDFELTALGRFSRMQQDYRFLVDDQLICGLQVHVGVDDRDTAVRVAQRVAPDLPTLLAMSASSPYWHGSDSGYASFRTLVWQRWPTAGSFGALESAAEYDQQLEELIGSGVISDAKMAYFDVRPSSHVPTVELRVCDACPRVDDVVLIAGLFRALVDEAAAADATGAPMRRRPEPLHRAAMWRAARSGLSGPLLTPDRVPRAEPAVDVVRALVARLRDRLADNDDWDEVSERAEALLAASDSSTRQRRRFAERGMLTDVVTLTVAETRSHTSYAVTRPEVSAGYADAPDDEALAPSGVPYRGYRALFAVLDELGVTVLQERSEAARAGARAAGLTFGVDGVQQPFPVDLVPRIVAAHEWSVLAAGLTQRARTIELFLRDVYGPARVVADGILDWATVRRCSQWLPAAQRLPTDVVRAPVIGFDLVRDALGGWRVLEDNCRVPSGVGYAVGLRRVMREIVPELDPDGAVRDPATVLPLLGRTLRACGPRPDSVVALLSDGADNSAWFEHRLIAEEAGLLLVQPGEIEVTQGQVRAGGRRIDVLYLRLGVDLPELRSPGRDALGAELVAAAAAGAVVLANAPGAGVADDKAMYCLMPELTSYYLGERPLLAPVPTYRCANPVEREFVLASLDTLVTKPVDGYGGGGVLIGPRASAAELAERRRKVTENPVAWIAQEVVALSTHPTLGDDGLEPRHVDLRAFVYQSGPGPGEAHLADLALTRVAPRGSMIVNSSRGGGAKDTWIIRDPDEESAGSGG